MAHQLTLFQYNAFFTHWKNESLLFSLLSLIDYIHLKFKFFRKEINIRAKLM